MVFCYKIITESPRLGDCISPRKASPLGRLPDLPNSLSHMVNSLKYSETGDDILDDIPEREWRLLAALARKRDEHNEREKLADEFRMMWQKEKIERDYVTAKISEEYKQYLSRKREDQNILHELRSFHLRNKEQRKQGFLIDTIRYKEKRSADLLAFSQDRKAHEIVEKVLEEEARAILAADRRYRKGAAEDWKRRAELVDDLRKVDAARSRRTAQLKATAQKVAITNALSTWESALLKEEATAINEFRRAQHAAHAELTRIRCARLEQERESRLQRTRRVAAFTAQLRDAVRMTRS